MTLSCNVRRLLFERGAKWPAAGLLFAFCFLLFTFPARAATWQIVVDVANKTVTCTNAVAVRENVPVQIINLGGTTPANLLLQVLDRTNGVMATGGSFAASGQNATGTVSFNTIPLVAAFSNLPAQSAKPYTLALFDTNLVRLLVNDQIEILNNPFVAGVPDPTPPEQAYWSTWLTAGLTNETAARIAADAATRLLFTNATLAAYGAPTYADITLPILNSMVTAAGISGVTTAQVISITAPLYLPAVSGVSLALSNAGGNQLSILDLSQTITNTYAGMSLRGSARGALIDFMQDTNLCVRIASQSGTSNFIIRTEGSRTRSDLLVNGAGVTMTNAIVLGNLILGGDTNANLRTLSNLHYISFSNTVNTAYPITLKSDPAHGHLAIYQHLPYASTSNGIGRICELLLYNVFSNGSTQRCGTIGSRDGFGNFIYTTTNENYLQIFDDDHGQAPLMCGAVTLSRSGGPYPNMGTYQASKRTWPGTADDGIQIYYGPDNKLRLTQGTNGEPDMVVVAYPATTSIESLFVSKTNTAAQGVAGQLIFSNAATFLGAINAGGQSITNIGRLLFSDGAMVRSNGSFYAPKTTALTNDGGALFTGDLRCTNETYGWRQASVPYGYTLNGVLSSGPELNCPVNSSSTFLLFETGTPFSNKLVYVRGLLHFDPSETSTGIVNFSCAMRSYTNATVSAAAITSSYSYNITNNGTMIQPFAFTLTNWPTAINGTAYIQIQPSGTLFRAYRCVIVGAPEFRKE